MKKLNELTELLANVANFIVIIEENQDTIKSLSTHTTLFITQASKFLQTNMENIFGMVSTSMVNTWGGNLKLRCEYLGSAREILVSAGFTPDESYDILMNKRDELKSFIDSTVDTIKKIRDEQTTQKNKASNKTCG